MIFLMRRHFSKGGQGKDFTDLRNLSGSVLERRWLYGGLVISISVLEYIHVRRRV
jgi:hypothetical protein